MSNKLIMTVVTGLALAFTAQSVMAAPASPWINKRERHQAHRIYNGIVNGQLTFPEARRLIRGEVRIHRLERKLKRYGLTPAERVLLHSALNVESARIFVRRH